MKIKTFLFESGEAVKYSRIKREKTNGMFCYDFDSEVVDNTINEFIKGKKNISITQNSFIKGNNPPTTILIYTIVYED